MSVFSVQDVFSRFYGDYVKLYGLDYHLDKVARDIMACRTASLGANAQVCEDCGTLHVHYNSCGNRHCNICQSIPKEKWIDARKSEVINAPYFHVVFTVPHELNFLFLSNQEVLYPLLYKAVSETLLELSSDKKFLGADIGLMSFLHTWGSNLSYHPHIHSIVLGGGLTKDFKFKESISDFFLPIRVLSKVFRGKFLDYLKKLFVSGKLSFPSGNAGLKNRFEFKSFIDSLYKKEWIPYVKETLHGARNVIEYLGRYTHRIAIANSRITDISGDGVTFTVKDYRNNGVSTSLTLTPVEFIRRFLMHVLPKGFVKIRHYGILSNRSKSIKLQICRNILRCINFTSVLANLSSAEILLKLFGIDVCKCSACGSSALKSIPYHKRE